MLVRPRARLPMFRYVRPVTPLLPAHRALIGKSVGQLHETASAQRPASEDVVSHREPASALRWRRPRVRATVAQTPRAMCADPACADSDTARQDHAPEHTDVRADAVGHHAVRTRTIVRRRISRARMPLTPLGRPAVRARGIDSIKLKVSRRRLSSGIPNHPTAIRQKVLQGSVSDQHVLVRSSSSTWPAREIYCRCRRTAPMPCAPDALLVILTMTSGARRSVKASRSRRRRASRGNATPGRCGAHMPQRLMKQSIAPVDKQRIDVLSETASQRLHRSRLVCSNCATKRRCVRIMARECSQSDT